MSRSASVESDHACSGHAADVDLKLMQDVARGDESALAELLDRYQEPVRRFVGRLTAWHADGDDIVQEVFLQAWKQASRFERSGSLKSWLFQIALNRCRYHHRTSVRLVKRLVDLFQMRSSIANQTQSVEDPRWQSVQNAMVRLSHSDRELLVLVYMEDETIVSIAERLGIKEATLHVQLHRARQRLAEQIERDRTKA